MTDREILACVDHTLLKPTSTWEDVQKLCAEAQEHQVASVCVPPCYVHDIAVSYPSLNICTVIGFPLGYSVVSAKCAEAIQAIKDGAHELDVVVNIPDVKNARLDKVEAEVAAIRQACNGFVMKLIIETCYLTNEEKSELCRIVTNTGVDFIKTSTGFGSAGATLDDVLLFKQHIGPKVQIKASGGIRTRDDMVKYLEAGCTRLGTSSAISILGGRAAEGIY